MRQDFKMRKSKDIFSKVVKSDIFYEIDKKKYEKAVFNILGKKKK